MNPQRDLEFLAARARRRPTRVGSLPGLRRAVRGQTVEGLRQAMARTRRRLGLPAEGAVVPVKGAAALAPPAFRFAVNTVSYLKGESERYGSLPAIMRDMQALGADVVRHPGGVQMFTERLLISDIPADFEVGNERPFMRPIERDWMDRENLVGMVLRSRCFEALEQVVRAMAGEGLQQRLMITLFDLGAGSEGPWGAGAFEDVTSAPIDTTHMGPIGIAWADTHLGQEVWDPIAGENVAFAGGAPTAVDGMERKWALFTMDPADAYKRVFFRELAAAVGRAFTRLYERLLGDTGKGIDLSLYIEGVEICNEVEVLHTLRGRKSDPKPGGDPYSADPADAEVDGGAWGDFYYYCATGIREECDWLPIWVGGIASHSDSKGGAATWEQKRAYLEGVLIQVQAHEAAVSGTEPGETDLSDLVAGVDYHFYHFGEDISETEREDALPLVLLYLETAELREILNTYVPGATMSVVETSVNVVCSPGSVEDAPETVADESMGCEATSDFRGSPAFRPERSVCACTSEDCPTSSANRVDDFQGASVWMRLGAAKAGGATLLGWHSHIANAGSAFTGCGLRMDFLDVESSTQAYPRKSWFAFRQLTSVLDGATGVNVLSPRFAEWDPPGRPSARTFRDTYESTHLVVPTSDLIWVLEYPRAAWPYRPGTATRSGFPWAYLCFIEPGSETAATRSPACADLFFWQPATRSEARVFQVPTGPRDGVLSRFKTEVSRGYPRRLWTGDPVVSVPFITAYFGSIRQWQATVSHGDWPILLLSTEKLYLAGITPTDAL